MAQPDFSRMSDQELEDFLRQNAPTNSPNGLGASPQVQEQPLAPIPGSSVQDFSKMDDRRLDQEIANRNPSMGMLEDVSRSTVTGLQRGAASLGGMFGDLRQAPEDLALMAAQKFGGMTPEQAAQIQGLGRTNGQYQGLMPTSRDLNALDDKFAGPQHEPQTSQGRYAEAISSMAPAAAFGPGGVGSKFGLAVGSGAGGELSADLAPEQYKPAARFAGQLLGGLPAVGVTALMETPQRLVNNAIGGADVAPAIALMRDAQARGINLTLAEAVQQTTNSGTGMGRMQRVLEGTREGEQAFNPFFAQRPGQVDQAVRGFADTMAAPTNQPSALGPRAQEAAQGGLDRIRQGFNEQARPHYEALQGQTMPEAEFGQLTLDPSFQAALTELRANPELNASIATLPDNNLSVINEVQKQLHTNAGNAVESQMRPNGNNRLASLRTGAANQVNDAASTASDDWTRAREIISQGNRDYLDPLKAGPGGAIASSPDVPSQLSALYPQNPLAGASNETTQAMRLMQLGEQQVPGVGADLTRQHLLTALEGATKDLQGGPNQWAGAKYAKAIAGSPEQAATLNAGVGATGGDTQRLDALLEVLRATGKRQPAGSKTAFNTEDLKDFGIPTPDRFNPANPMDYLKGIGNMAKTGQYRRNTNRLAEVLMMGPDEAERFLRHARGR